MRSLFGISLVALLAAAPILTMAQPAEDISAVQVVGVQPAYQLQPHQTAAMAGIYRLDNGGMFHMKAANHRLMAQLDGREATELMALSDTRFVSRDQRMTVEYQPQAFGDTLLLTYPLDLARADSPMVSVRLAVN